MSSILQAPHWPQSLSNFVTSCLMWDPRNRPTSTQALNHEYFADAVDPIRPKSSGSRLLGRKMSEKSFKPNTKESNESPTLSSKPSWFRRSLVMRSDSPAPILEPEAVERPLVVANTMPEVQISKVRSAKRATWANGAPMPILPSIRPVSPLSNAVTAQANSSVAHGNDHNNSQQDESGKSKKIGRQLSVNSHGNHYADIHRQEAERALNGLGGGSNMTPQKEGFFSHLRKRARRLSGRNQAAAAAAAANYDVEANAGCSPWPNRSSVVLDSNMIESKTGEFTDFDKTVQNVKYGPTSAILPPQLTSIPNQAPSKRQSVPQVPMRSMTESPIPGVGGPISSRTRRALQMTSHPVHRYETPEEEDELLDEVLHSADKAARRLALNYDTDSISSLYKDDNRLSSMVNESTRTLNPYPTPSPSAKRDGVTFGECDSTPVKQRDLSKMNEDSSNRLWPTPPYGEQEWASSVANTILSGSTFR